MPWCGWSGIGCAIASSHALKGADPAHLCPKRPAEAKHSMFEDQPLCPDGRLRRIGGRLRKPSPRANGIQPSPSMRTLRSGHRLHRPLPSDPDAANTTPELGPGADNISPCVGSDCGDRVAVIWLLTAMGVDVFGPFRCQEQRVRQQRTLKQVSNS